MWEGANPLRYIEELHDLLTKGRLERLPLWSMGSNDALQRAAQAGGARLDRSGMVGYQRGLLALANRDYRAAVANLSSASRLHFEAAPLRPLLAYALCRAGDLGAASQLAHGTVIHNADERPFWSWLASTFRLDSASD